MWETILGAGLNLFGGLLGSSAEKKAQETNQRIAEENLAWQKEQFYKLLAEAQRQEQEGKLGYTDAQGNHVHYEPGKGWVTDLSPQQLMTRNQQNRETERVMAQDVPLQRERMFANVAQQRGEGDYANALMEAMHQEQLGTPQDESAIKNMLAAEGINQGYDASLESALRNARATGSSNDAQLVAASSRARGDDLRKAFLENTPQAAADDNYNRYATKQGNTAQMYNQMATRASGRPGVDYNPQDIQGATAQLMQSAAGAGQSADKSLLNAMGTGMNIQNNYQAKPLYGMGTSIAQLGSTIGSMNFGGSGYGGSSYFGSGSSPASTIGADYYKNNVGPW